MNTTDESKEYILSQPQKPYFKQMCYIKSCIVIESGLDFETQSVKYFNGRSGKDGKPQYFFTCSQVFFLITTFQDLRNLTVKRIDTAFLLK